MPTRLYDYSIKTQTSTPASIPAPTSTPAPRAPVDRNIIVKSVDSVDHIESIDHNTNSVLSTTAETMTKSNDDGGDNDVQAPDKAADKMTTQQTSDDDVAQPAAQSPAVRVPRKSAIRINAKKVQSQKRDSIQSQEEDCTELTEDVVSKALIEQGENLEKVLSVVLRKTDTHARARVKSAIETTIKGTRFTDMMAETGLTLPMINAYMSNYPAFRDLWVAARDVGDQIRHLRRVDLADKHAIEGTERPVFQQGKRVGVIREWDHKLLQWLIEADDPAKYRPKAPGVSGNVNVGVVVEFNVGEPELDSEPGPTAIDIDVQPIVKSATEEVST